MKQNVLELKNVTKKVGGKNIVDNLSFSVKKGEIFGLLGPNGAGKTTTIRMIVGLIRMTKGKVIVNHIDIDKDYPKAMNEIGTIVENPEMYPFLTGYQNLLHFARMAVANITKERIDEVIKLVGLQAAINDKVKTYSLGMLQRLGVAQAILHRPTLLILDEPTNGLDPKGIIEFRNYLRDLSKNGTSVLVSSHLLSEMQLMCDRVAIIQHGKLIEIDSVNELEQSNRSKKIITQFKVQNAKESLNIIVESFPNIQGRTREHLLELVIQEDQIPLINNELVQNGVNVYAIKSKKQTLEDKFMEVTNVGDHHEW